ncbi:MAG TPA: YciI family protein [Streptosporangiaceae bacterium]|jgi:uncharacterized protein YciI
MSDYFLVTQARGPTYDPSRARREQAGWTEHAAFMDALAEEGVIVLGGPVGDLNEDDVLLVMDVASEAEVRVRLAGDPWSETILVIKEVQPWSVWLRGARWQQQPAAH